MTSYIFYILLISIAHFHSSQPQRSPSRLIPNGSQQIYKFVNRLAITDFLHSTTTQEKESSYTFKSQLQINSVWSSAKEQLLEIYFTKPTVSASSVATVRGITKIPDRPFYVSLVDGRPSNVIAHTSRDQSLLNLERGIASLLQVRFESAPVQEVDVSGQCSVFYAVKSSTRIEKTKTDCSHWDLRVHYRAEKALGVHQHSRENVHYELTAEGMLSRVEAIETHRLALAAKTDAGSQVESQMLLKHVTVGDEAVKQLAFTSLEDAVASLLEWYRVFEIEADVDGALSEIKHTTLKQEISRRAAQLADEHIGSEALALAIVQLLPLARITKQAQFVEILNSQRTLESQLIDLLGAVQTRDAHNAVLERFPLQSEKHVELLERYLQSLTVGTHPERFIIENLFEQLQNKTNPISNSKLRDSVLQTVASLTKHSGLDGNDPLLGQLRTFMLAQLETGCGKDADCKTLHIRALQNLQDASTIATLISHAATGELKVAVAAMQALVAFPISNYREEHRRTFTQMFYQNKRKYDSSVRIMSLDILLAMKPTKEQLSELLDYLASADRHFEVKTFVIQKLRMLSEKCPRFRNLLLSCLAERPKVNNYNVIAQKGLTTVLHRQLSQEPSFNESLLSVQEIYQGVLKRGSVELVLAAGSDDMSTFKLALYTNGLSSFVGDDSANEIDDAAVDDSPATAGMEIAVNGVLLRPLVFFTGQSELMGHVWSGTASDLTPAYQATTLLQDHEHYIVLSSGATVYVRIAGARSIDLSGKVELSIWNRNANTIIHQKSGVAVSGVIVAGSTYARLESTFVITNEPGLSLQADIDFYSDMKLCIQLQRPETVQTHNNTRKVILNAGTRYAKRISKSHKHKSPGRTLALNQKNNDMCNLIFAD